MAVAKQLLELDLAGLFAAGSGITPTDLEALVPALAAARERLLDRTGESDHRAISPRAIETATNDSAASDPAGTLLADYRAQRGRSRLGRILSLALRLAAEVDRLVVVASPATLLGLRAILDATCHPFHNELSRAERGGQPRIYPLGDALDNDSLAGLLDLLAQAAPPRMPEGRWGLVVDHWDDFGPAQLAAIRILADRLRVDCGQDFAAFASRALLIGRPLDSAECAGFEHELVDGPLPAELFGARGPAAELFRGAVLLCAAASGADLRRLLEGAAGLYAHFASEPARDNLVLQLAGAMHLAESVTGSRHRLASRQIALHSLVAWHHAYLAQVARQPSISNGPAVSVNLMVERSRRDRLAAGNVLLSELEQQELDVARRRRLTAGELEVDLRLAHCDERAIGQLFELLALTTGIQAELVCGAG